MHIYIHTHTYTMYYLKLYNLHRSFVMRWGMTLNVYCTTLHFIGYFVPEYFKESLSLKSSWLFRGVPWWPRGEDLAFHKGPATPAGRTKILQAMRLGNHCPASPKPPNKEELFISQLSWSIFFQQDRQGLVVKWTQKETKFDNRLWMTASVLDQDLVKFTITKHSHKVKCVLFC